MAKKTTPPQELPQPNLIVKRDEALSHISDRIAKGKDLLNSPVANADDFVTAKQQVKVWHEYNEELLSRLFSNEKIAKHYRNHSHAQMFTVRQPFHEEVQYFKEGIQKKLSNLESVVERLPLFPESSDVQSKSDEKEDTAKLLHPVIQRECEGLVDSGYYGEAVEKGFKIVRDKLRALTGHETSSEAFGKGGLFIKGAAASNVEDDFQSAVKFLGMSIDFFRNEKAHTSTANVATPERAYQYLILASLELYHLDQGEIRKVG